MRILLCVNQDLIANIALNFLIKELMGKEHELFITLSDLRMKQKTDPVLELDDLQLLERDIAAEVLFPLMDSLPVNVEAEFNTFRQIERRFDITTSFFKNLNHPEGEEWVRSIKPDLILSVRFGTVFKERLIEIPKHGILNFHSGILPQYRGVMPTFRSMLNDETHYGGTLHFVDPGIDTGPVVDICRLPIQPQHSMFWHLVNLYPECARLCREAVERLENKQPMASLTQDETKKCYYTFPVKHEVQAFLNKGFRFFSREEYMDVLGRYGKPVNQQKIAA